MKKLLLALMTFNSINLLGTITATQEEATQQGWPGNFPVTCTEWYQTKVCNDYDASRKLIGTRCGGPHVVPCTAADTTATPGTVHSCDVSDDACNANILGTFTVTQEKAKQKRWPGIFPVTCTESYQTKVCNDYNASGTLIGTRCGGKPGQPSENCRADNPNATPGTANSCNVSNHECNARGGRPLISISGGDVNKFLDGLSKAAQKHFWHQLI